MSNHQNNNLTLELKTKILLECKRIINEKITSLNAALNDVTEASNTESKSSAGDKHETSKAMMHIEQEKLSKQLSEIKTQKNELEKVNLNTSKTIIGPGSLVETNNGMFFIGVSIGKIKMDGQEIFVVSPQSPIGIKLMGLQEKSFTLNSTLYTIHSVL